MCGATCTNGNWVLTDAFDSGEYGFEFVSVQDCMDKCYSHIGYTMANVATRACDGSISCYCQKGASSAADLAAAVDTSSDYVTCYTGTDDSVAVPTGDDEDAVCFAATESLLLDSGSKVAMDQVKLGDRVQVASAADDSLAFAEVIFLPHGKFPSMRHLLRLKPPLELL